MVKRNIFISYLLAFSKNTWFWMGIWVFYYLRYTNYAGVGLMETVLILSMTLSEIPTGALADLLGKRITLIFSFLFLTGGMLMMATAINFSWLLFSVLVLGIGGTLYSGTIDALVFDTLKQHGKEKRYDKIISTIGTINLLGPAVCAIIGGFLYKIAPNLPFLASTAGYAIGLVGAFFLIEPQIDSEKFSLKNFIYQTHKGISELTKSYDVRKQTLLLLSVGFFVVIATEELNSFLGVEFGFTALQLSFLWSAIFIIAALSSQLTPYIRKHYNDNLFMIVLGIFFAVTLFVSPFLGIILGGISLTIRSSLEGIFGNVASIMINNNTVSKYRATTLSTFNMIKNIPYVATAYFIGAFSDKFSARHTAMAIGILLCVILAIQLFWDGQRKGRLS